jgi:hypothetical protein
MLFAPAIPLTPPAALGLASCKPPKGHEKRTCGKMRRRLSQSIATLFLVLPSQYLGVFWRAKLCRMPKPPVRGTYQSHHYHGTHGANTLHTTSKNRCCRSCRPCRVGVIGLGIGVAEVEGRPERVFEGVCCFFTLSHLVRALGRGSIRYMRAGRANFRPHSTGRGRGIWDTRGPSI